MKHNPRVLWVTSHYPTPVSPATGTYLRGQAQALIGASVDVSVVAPTPFSPAPLARISPKWRAYSKVLKHYQDGRVHVRFPRYLATPNQNYSGIPHKLMALSIVRSVNIEDFDLLHGHFAYPEGLAVVRLAETYGKPSIVTLHGSDVNVYPHHDKRSRERFRTVVQGANAVIAVSNELAEQTNSLTGVKPTVKHLGVNLDLFDALPTMPEARKALGLPMDKFLVLFVGNLIRTKGVLELLSAMTRSGLSDALALFVGQGPLAEAIQGVANARLIGVVPNDVVPLYMAAADVLALPSYSEGTPTVVVEAGAAGLPVVASAVGGTTSLLGDGRGRLIAPADTDSLYEGLRSVRSGAGEGREGVSRLRRFIQENHNAAKNAEELRTLYEAILLR